MALSNTVDILGDDVVFVDLVERDFAGSYYDDRLNAIAPHAFQDCMSLTGATFPNASYIQTYAFAGCVSLTEVIGPSIALLGDGAFYNCSALTRLSISTISGDVNNDCFNGCTSLIELPAILATRVFYRAFQSCSSLQSIELPNTRYIMTSAFCDCISLSDVSAPLLTIIGDRTFEGCTSLKAIYAPLLSSMGASAFGGCSTLTEAVFPELTTMSLYCFRGCTALSIFSAPKYSSILYFETFRDCISLQECNAPLVSRIIDDVFLNCSNLRMLSFQLLEYIGPRAFNGCHALESIYLLYSSVASLYNVNAFWSTPIHYSSYLGHYGSIFVPASLVDAYKSATNWAVYADRITAYVEP